MNYNGDLNGRMKNKVRSHNKIHTHTYKLSMTATFPELYKSLKAQSHGRTADGADGADLKNVPKSL